MFRIGLGYILMLETRVAARIISAIGLSMVEKLISKTSNTKKLGWTW